MGRVTAQYLSLQDFEGCLIADSIAKGYISNRSSKAYYWNEKRCQLKICGISLGPMFKPVWRCA